MSLLLLKILIGYIAIGTFITFNVVWLAFQVENHILVILLKVKPITTSLGIAISVITWPNLFRLTRK